MKVLTRLDFLKLPANTVYAEGCLANFSEWRIKGETTGNDFYLTQINYAATDHNSSEEFFDQYIQMVDNHSEFPFCSNSEQRDGLFDPHHIFLVLDSNDVKSLISTLITCIKE